MLQPKFILENFYFVKKTCLKKTTEEKATRTTVPNPKLKPPHLSWYVDMIEELEREVFPEKMFWDVHLELEAVQFAQDTPLAPTAPGQKKG